MTHKTSHNCKTIWWDPGTCYCFASEEEFESAKQIRWKTHDGVRREIESIVGGNFGPQEGPRWIDYDEEIDWLRAHTAWSKHQRH